MCRSVPQIEAARTRTSTSAGPTVGIFAISNERPRAGCILRKAFIVVGMLEATWQALLQARNYHASTPLRSHPFGPMAFFVYVPGRVARAKLKSPPPSILDQQAPCLLAYPPGDAREKNRQACLEEIAREADRRLYCQI